MQAVVTGGAGFIGSTLVDRLMSVGHAVIAIDDLSTGFRSNLEAAYGRNRFSANRFCLIERDIRDPGLTDLIADARPDVVFHLAAHVDLRASVTGPLADAQSNVLGTINVLEASRRAKVPRVVYAASGGSRYGAPERLPVTEEVQPAPMSPYAAAKVAGEMYLQAYTAMYGIAAIALALANVYGPRQDPRGEAGVIATFANAMANRRPTTIYGDGSTTRDYVYVGDVVDAFVRAAEAPPHIAGLYNVGTGTQTTVSSLHTMIADAVGVQSKPVYGSPRPGEVAAIALDAGKAERDLGWRPCVSLRDGIKNTVAWLREGGALSPVAATHEF